MSVRFGILGTGSIATEVAGAIATSERCSVVAVSSRDSERARAFAAANGIERWFGSYEEMLAAGGMDVVYVATPHPQHREWASAAISAGHHVLCEKPLTINRGEAEGLFSEAADRGVLLLEAFAYRFHPQTSQLLRIVAGGDIGELRGLSVSFSYNDPSTRHVRRELGGGSILDVGCYCTSMAGQLVSAATGDPCPEPVEVLAMADLDPREETDRSAHALMRYAPGIVAHLTCGVQLTQDHHVRAYGDRGWVEVGVPAWLEGFRSAPTTVTVHPDEGAARTYEQAGGRIIFSREVDGVADLLTRPAEWDSWASTTLANMSALDAWRAAVGVRYGDERATGAAT